MWPRIWADSKSKEGEEGGGRGGRKETRGALFKPRTQHHNIVGNKRIARDPQDGAVTGRLGGI
eukprot:6641826-Pyramimonas_sp.AAC.1